MFGGKISLKRNAPIKEKYNEIRFAFPVPVFVPIIHFFNHDSILITDICFST